MQKAEMRAHGVVFDEDLPYKTDKPEKIIKAEDFEKELERIKKNRERAMKRAETMAARKRKDLEAWGVNLSDAAEDRWLNPDR